MQRYLGPDLTVWSAEDAAPERSRMRPNCSYTYQLVCGIHWGKSHPLWSESSLAATHQHLPGNNSSLQQHSPLWINEDPKQTNKQNSRKKQTPKLHNLSPQTHPYSGVFCCTICWEWFSAEHCSQCCGEGWWHPSTLEIRHISVLEKQQAFRF